MALTQVTSIGLKDGEIVNADLHSAAAIVLSKLNTTGTASSSTFLRGDGAWTAIDLSNLNASNLTSGTVGTARLGSGTASSSTFLRGDGSWQTMSADGGNAATLDSIDSSQFLRSDASDTMSGILSLTSSSQYPLTINGSHDGKIVLQGSNNPYIRFKEGTTDKAYIQWNQDGFLDIKNEEDSSRLLIRDNLNFSQDAINFKKIWNEYNDGSGSGLDADKLDGSEATKFLSSYDRTTTTGWEDSNRNFRINGGSTGSAGLAFHDSAGTFQFQIYGASGNSEYGFLNANWGGWDIRKIAGGALYVNSASQVWHAGNDGAGSGLDADLWDGDQKSTYLNQAVRTDSNVTHNKIISEEWFRNTTTGEGLYNQANDAHFYSAGNQYWHINGNSGDITNGALIFYSQYNSTQGNSTGRKGYVYWDTNGFGLLHSGGGWAVRTTSSATALFGTLTHGGSNTIWHAGNDGSGSGLDADTVDGIQASSFLRADTNDTVTGGPWHLTNTNSSWAYRFQNNTASNSSVYMSHGGGYGMHIRNDTGGTSHYLLQVYGSNGTDFMVRGGDALVTSGGNTMWHAGNDGASSGLDADTVDGLQSSSFLRSDADDTFTGGLVSSSRDEGIFGVYDSYKTDHIWSMGTGYKNHSSGTNFGGLYGLAYKHVNNSTGGTMGGSHQMVWCHNGGARGAIGYNQVWHAEAMRVTSSNHLVMHAGNDGSGSGFDADTCDGQHLGTGANPTFSNVYVNSWHRNNDSGDGLYNDATTSYFYSDHDDVYNVAGGSSANWIRFRDEHAGTIRGYVGANTSFAGFLDSAGNWAFSSNQYTNYSYRDLACSPDGSHDLGYGNRRWDNVYATNGTIQTSDRNEKENIVATDLGLDFVNKLSPVSFKRKGKTRTHYGFIAQDIEQIITDLGKTTTQFAPLIKSDISEAKDGSEYRYGLRYEQLLAPVVKAIQELAVKVAALESA